MGGAAALLLQWPYRNYQFSQMMEAGEPSVSVSPPPPSLAGEGLNFVNFQTSWCGHSQKLAPIWAELESSEGGSCRISSIDCDREKDTCKRYNVRGYPTLMLMNDGKRLNASQRRNIDDGARLLRCRNIVYEPRLMLRDRQLAQIPSDSTQVPRVSHRQAA